MKERDLKFNQTIKYFSMTNGRNWIMLFCDMCVYLLPPSHILSENAVFTCLTDVHCKPTSMFRTEIGFLQNSIAEFQNFVFKK